MAATVAGTALHSSSSPALKFRVVAECSRSRARASVMTLPHHTVHLPTFMPVGTQGTMKGLLPQQVKEAGAEIILGNTYHLGNCPGKENIATLGGLHQLMGWDRALLTDSGGFQMVSLSALSQVTEEGVKFQSPYDGSECLLTPEESIAIQNALGADIMMQLDDVVDVVEKDYERFKTATYRTTRWLDRCMKANQNPQRQNLFPIVQGGLHEDLRAISLDQLIQRDAPGYAIGGLSGGEAKDQFWRVVYQCTGRLPLGKPRYCMGVGFAVDLVVCCALGADMFDCVYPTRTARFGCALIEGGQINLKSKEYATDFRPLDPTCTCSTCTNYTRAYLHTTATRLPIACHLLSVHNVVYQMQLMSNIRTSIVERRFPKFVMDFMASYYRGRDYPTWITDALAAVNINLTKIQVQNDEGDGAIATSHTKEEDKMTVVATHIKEDKKEEEIDTGKGSGMETTRAVEGEMDRPTGGLEEREEERRGSDIKERTKGASEERERTMSLSEERQRTIKQPEERERSNRRSWKMDRTMSLSEERRRTVKQPEERERTSRRSEERERTVRKSEERERTEGSLEERERTNTRSDNERTNKRLWKMERAISLLEERERTIRRPEERNRTKGLSEERERTKGLSEERERTTSLSEERERTVGGSEERSRTIRRPEDRGRGSEERQRQTTRGAEVLEENDEWDGSEGRRGTVASFDQHSGFDKLQVTGYREGILDDFPDQETAGRVAGWRAGLTRHQRAANPVHALSRLAGALVACQVKLDLTSTQASQVRELLREVQAEVVRCSQPVSPPRVCSVEECSQEGKGGGRNEEKWEGRLEDEKDGNFSEESLSTLTAATSLTSFTSTTATTCSSREVESASRLVSRVEAVYQSVGWVLPDF